MIRFTALTRRARLGLTTAAVFGLLAMAAPAVHATTITEDWSTGSATSWSSQWDYVNSDVVFRRTGSKGYVELPKADYPNGHTLTSPKALINTQPFTNSAQQVDISTAAGIGNGGSLLARYNDDGSGGNQSYYEANFIKSGLYNGQLSIQKKTSTGVSTIIGTAAVTVPLPTGSTMFFTVQDVLGGVQLDLTFNYGTVWPSPNHGAPLVTGLVASLSVLDINPLTGSGQVGLGLQVRTGYTTNNPYMFFDNYQVDSLPDYVPASAPVPEPASLTLLGLGGLLMFAGNRRRRVGLNG